MKTVLCCFSYILSIARSSHRRCFVRKDVLRDFAKLTGKHLCQSLFFNKVTHLRPATLLKKRLWHRCFPVNFAKFLRTSFLQNTSGRMLLYNFDFSKKCGRALLIKSIGFLDSDFYHVVFNIPNVRYFVSF